MQAADAPNLIFINIDDLGYADIGPFGSKLNRTPNLDRMAQEGRKLTCFYAAPVCSPSRASLMTGCYPKRALPHSRTCCFRGTPSGLAPEEITVAELLKKQGYATGCIGKWHLGDQPEFLPPRQGFDYYFGLPYSNDMGPAEDGVKSSLGAADPQAAKAKGQGQPPLPLLRNETVLKRVLADDQTTLVALYTEEAVKFIREHKDEPFFLYLPHSAVHFPIYPGKAFQGKSNNGIYGDWVEEVDWSVGQVLDTVRELGLSENTLVIFTSDNGGTQRGVNAPLRGFKGSTWEGGMREPTIAWWPGKIPAGTADRRRHQHDGHSADLRETRRRQSPGGSQAGWTRYLADPGGRAGRHVAARRLLLLPRTELAGGSQRSVEAAPGQDRAVQPGSRHRRSYERSGSPPGNRPAAAETGRTR